MRERNCSVRASSLRKRTFGTPKRKKTSFRDDAPGFRYLVRCLFPLLFLPSFFSLCLLPLEYPINKVRYTNRHCLGGKAVARAGGEGLYSVAKTQLLSRCGNEEASRPVVMTGQVNQAKCQVFLLICEIILFPLLSFFFLLFFACQCGSTTNLASNSVGRDIPVCHGAGRVTISLSSALLSEVCPSWGGIKVVSSFQGVAALTSRLRSGLGVSQRRPFVDSISALRSVHDVG